MRREHIDEVERASRAQCVRARATDRRTLSCTAEVSLQQSASPPLLLVLILAFLFFLKQKEQKHKETRRHPSGGMFVDG